MAGAATGNVCAMDIRIHADDSESTRRWICIRLHSESEL